MNDGRFREVPRRMLSNVKLNAVDKVINYFNPVKGAQRLRARMIMSWSGNSGAYKGAKKDRRGLAEFNPGSGSADADINPSLPTLRDRSRELARDSMLAGGAIHTAVNNVVGPGLRLNSQIDQEFLGLTDKQTKDFQDKAERGFELFVKECPLNKTGNFYDLQELAFRSTLESGDVFFLTPWDKRNGEMWGLKLQVIEGDRVSNPQSTSDTEKLIAGIELDDKGAPSSYHIQTTHPGDNKTYKREWQKYPGYVNGRKNVIHLFRQIRPDQHRGVPYLAPVIEPLKQLERYTDAELMAAVIAGMFTVFIKSESGEGLANISPEVESGTVTSTEGIKMDYGAILDLMPGEEIDTANPGRPNTAFDQFVMAIIRQIGCALELPYEILIKAFTSSYSASRAAILDAWMFFRARRRWLTDNFCDPIYELWMREAVASGYLSAPGFFKSPLIRQAYLRANWLGPIMQQIDPVKDIDAASKRMENALTTHEEECQQLTGTKWSPKKKKILEERSVFAMASTRQAGGDPSTGSGRTDGNGKNNPDDESADGKGDSDDENN